MNGKHDRWIVIGFIAFLLLAWGLFALLPLIALRSSAFTLKTSADVERVKSTLGQLGTYGDMFGALNCLFSGSALIGVVYAVILQRRELHHQQVEIEQNKRDREAAEKAREKELKDAAYWQRRTSLLTAINFLAQTNATKLAAFPVEKVVSQDGKMQEAMRNQKTETAKAVDRYIGMLTRSLELLGFETDQDLRTVEAYQAGFEEGKISAIADFPENHR